MSASATLTNQLRYRDQLKLMRAETAASWAAAAFDRVIKILKIEPASIAIDEDVAKPQRYFGAYY
jgi:hypothetical protein